MNNKHLLASKLSAQGKLAELYALRQLRKQIADIWINTEESLLEGIYHSRIGQIHKLLIYSGIKEEDLTEAELRYVENNIKTANLKITNEKDIKYWLAAILYFYPDQLPLTNDLIQIPDWLIKDYLEFMLSVYDLHNYEDPNRYYRHMQRFVNHLHEYIFANKNSKFGIKVAHIFTETVNLIPLYFTNQNLKDIYRKRAEICELLFRSYGYQVDYEFLKRSPLRSKVRLGILASHFTPSAETFASLPVYENITRNFEVILYSLTKTDHPLEQYCKSCANSFRLLPKSLTDQVNCIRSDDLDIVLIGTNVTGGTNNIYILGLHRLARIQVTSVASVVTTGIRNIDYYISGKLTEPLENTQPHYQEKLLKIDGTAHCFSYGTEINTAQIKVNRDSIGISREAVVFISGANAFKIIPELSHTWAKIIAAVPNSVLVLTPFGPNWSSNYPKQSFAKRLKKLFSQNNVDPERLVILDPEPVPNRNDIKEYLKLADIYLDSYPFSGTTSIIDPLEVGLPVVVRRGNCFRSAMGAALLQAIAMPKLVTTKEKSYIQLAIALATNPELRQQKSNQIKQKMQGNPPFLDSRAYSAKMESLFQELFRNYQADTLSNNLRLRDINLIIFPDWSQPEELITQDLANVVRGIATHPDKRHITLLVETHNISEEDADLALSSVVMNLLMEENLELEEELEISILGKLSDMQWEALLTRLQSRIILENENQEAITQAKADKISAWELNSLSEKRAVQQETGNWVLQTQ